MKNKKNKNFTKDKADYQWIIKIVLLTLFFSIILSLVSELIIPNVFIIISIILILIFIGLGIIFDMIGIAITTADIKTFHSMATKKMKGAKTAIKLINAKEKVSSFCNDVVGDICGVMSGSCGLSVAIKIYTIFNLNPLLSTVITTSIISALTIGGKALGKSIAVNNNEKIVFSVSKLLSTFHKD